MSANQSAFTPQKMAELDSQAFDIYLQAESNPTAEKYCQAGKEYDRSYESRWGDYVFAGKTWQEFIQNLGLSPAFIQETEVRKLILSSQESLVISCECYIKALEQDPNHYFANLYLATALTASLQVEASLKYWSKALKLRPGDTFRALVADSQGPNNKGLATKLVTEYLKLGYLNYESLLSNPDTKVYGEIAIQIDQTLDILKSLAPANYRQINIQSYQEQKKLAKNLLAASLLLRQNIQYLESDNTNHVQQQLNTQIKNYTPNITPQLENIAPRNIKQNNKKNNVHIHKVETTFKNNNQDLDETLDKDFRLSTKTQSRPKEITRICILGFVTTPLCMILALLPASASVGTWYPPFLFLGSLLCFVSFVGMWMMEKWGVYTYTFVFTFGQIALLSQGQFNPMSIIVPIAIIRVGFNNISKMS